MSLITFSKTLVLRCGERIIRGRRSRQRCVPKTKVSWGRRKRRHALSSRISGPFPQQRAVIISNVVKGRAAEQPTLCNPSLRLANGLVLCNMGDAFGWRAPAPSVPKLRGALVEVFARGQDAPGKRPARRRVRWWAKEGRRRSQHEGPGHLGLRTKISGQTARGPALDEAWGNSRLPKEAHGADELVFWPTGVATALISHALAS